MTMPRWLGRAVGARLFRVALPEAIVDPLVLVTVAGT